MPVMRSSDNQRTLRSILVALLVATLTFSPATACNFCGGYGGGYFPRRQYCGGRPARVLPPRTGGAAEGPPRPAGLRTTSHSVDRKSHARGAGSVVAAASDAVGRAKPRSAGRTSRGDHASADRDAGHGTVDSSRGESRQFVRPTVDGRSAAAGRGK